MTMPIRTPKDVDLYLVEDQRQMKMIDAKYCVKMGYWASKNHVQEYKVYGTMRQMFDLDFMNNL